MVLVRKHVAADQPCVAQAGSGSALDQLATPIDWAISGRSHGSKTPTQPRTGELSSVAATGSAFKAT